MRPLSVCPDCPVCNLVYCDQTVEWIKIPFDTEVGLGPGHIVLDGETGLEHFGFYGRPME